MKLSKIPSSRAKFPVSEVEALAVVLRGSLKGSPFTHFTHYDIIHGEPRSIRVLLPVCLGDAVSIPPALPGKMASELMKYLEQARFDPIPPDGKFIKGWEIQYVSFGNIPAAVASAVYIGI